MEMENGECNNHLIKSIAKKTDVHCFWAFSAELPKEKMAMPFVSCRFFVCCCWQDDGKNNFFPISFIPVANIYDDWWWWYWWWHCVVGSIGLTKNFWNYYYVIDARYSLFQLISNGPARGKMSNFLLLVKVNQIRYNYQSINGLRLPTYYLLFPSSWFPFIPNICIFWLDASSLVSFWWS